jgi:hypothetical protein
MDFGTTSSPFEVNRPEEAPTEPLQRKREASANTVAFGYAPVDSPTSQTNRLPPTILDTWGEINRAPISVRMYGDLVRLASLSAGWRGPGSQALKADSLKAFLKFWALVQPVAKEPEISLAADGTISAEWYESGQKRLDARFGTNDVIFGLFASNVIVEGLDKPEEVAQLLKLHRSRPLSWSKR